MKTPRRSSPLPLFVSAFLFLAMALLPGSAPAQTPGVARDLGALEVKYKADKEAQATTRDQAIAAAQKIYAAALDDAEQKYTLAGKTSEVQAILEEKKHLEAGKLPPAAAPMLPKTLNPGRAAYQREVEKAGKEYGTRTRLLSDEYLRALGSIEATARMNRQDTLVQQVAVLKRELLGGDGEASKPGSAPIVANGPSALVNANFAEKGKDDAPANWNHVGQGTAVVMTEGGTNFVRVTSEAEKPQSAIRQDFDRAPAARELVVIVKMRCVSMKGHGKFGIDSNQRNATDLVNAQDPFPASTEDFKNWKQFSGVVKLDPQTTKIVFRMFVVNAIGAVDFKDLHVEMR